VVLKRLTYILPLAIFALLALYFALGLRRDPSFIPSVLINQEVPDFALAAIDGHDKGFARSDLGGGVVLVNVFGSWCVSCRIEHPFLMKLKEKGVIPIYGIDWREPDRKTGPAWLAEFGNPYTLVGDDPHSIGAIAFGVTGAPETFVIDHRGVIRHKYQGPITEQSWNETLWPLIQALRAEKPDAGGK
jgi:cytochrome c biogenesis protein CcmG/thiol:disulfide interchange protein DsbE